MRRWWRREVRPLNFSDLGLSIVLVAAAGLLPAAIVGQPILPDWSALARGERLAHVVVIAAFVLLALGAYIRGRALLRVASLSERPVVPHRALIFTLSPPSPAPQASAGGSGWVVREVELTGTDLGRDIRSLAAAKGWPWQQVLRGLEKHVGTLTDVYLLGSPDTRREDGSVQEGSHRHLQIAYEFLGPYLPGMRVHWQTPMVDFDDVGRLMEALERAVKFLTNQAEPGPPLAEEDVIIDVTGGFKPTSIAGAAMTLNGPVTFQYVHTTTAEVIEYDLSHHGGSRS